MASGHIVASFDEDLAELNTMLARLVDWPKSSLPMRWTRLNVAIFKTLTRLSRAMRNSTKWNLTQ